jgi:hypothetical protein
MNDRLCLEISCFLGHHLTLRKTSARFDAMERAFETFEESVQARLLPFEVELHELTDAVSAGFTAYRSCTADHPATAAGYYFYSETVRALRESVGKRGWTAECDSNIEYVVHPDGHVRLFVLAGDGGTGYGAADLRSRRSRGERGRLAVHRNQLRLPVEENNSSADAASGEKPLRQIQTWALVHFVDAGAAEVRVELSLPTGISEEGRVEGWARRIILPSVGPSLSIPEPAAQPRIDVPVARRQP